MDLLMLTQKEDFAAFILNGADKKYGEIKSFEPVLFDRKHGYIVWEFMGMHEITFIDAQTKETISLFVSIDLNDTKNCYYQLIKRYGKNKV